MNGADSLRSPVQAIPARELMRLLKSTLAGEVGLAVLAAYFDDSGTHLDAAVVVWGGFLAPTTMWEDLDREWRTLLGKWELPYFHMARCEAGETPFEGWSRADRDRVIYEFREIILAHELVGISAAVAIEEWKNGMARIPLRGGFDAEQVCLAAVLRESILKCRKFTPYNQLAVIFDYKAFDRDIFRGISHFYEKFAGGNPELVGATFQKMSSYSGLQVADMLAWEYYGFCRDWLASGRTIRPRPHFQRFLEKGRLHPIMMDGPAIGNLMAAINRVLSDGDATPS